TLSVGLTCRDRLQLTRLAERPSRLAFAVLESFARARLAVLFAFLHAWIAREQAVRLQRGAQIRIDEQQRSRDTMPDRASLAGEAAAGHVHPHVKLVLRVGDREGSQGIDPQPLHHKVTFQAPAVDADLARTRRQAHTSDRGLAPPRGD